MLSPYNKRMRPFLKVFFFLYGSSILFGQNPLVSSDSLAQAMWVEEKYQQMTLEEKVGQLFMVMVNSNQTTQEKEKIKQLIANEKIGGIIFSKGGPLRQAKLCNEFQSLSKIPLLVGMDAEWGLAMRLDSTYAFPWNMTLGAIQDNTIIEKIGHRVGEHAKRLGVHINFAPDIDINTNPKNPTKPKKNCDLKYTLVTKCLLYRLGNVSNFWARIRDLSLNPV